MRKPGKDCPFLQLLPDIANPYVRDLVWTLSSQSDLLLSLPPYDRFELISASAPKQQSQLIDWLVQLDAAPAVLVDFIAAKKNTQRLGLYFEQLFAFYFSCCPTSEHSLLKHGYRLYDQKTKGKTTKGELDFLLIRNAEITHLEVAVKFFLGFPEKIEPKNVNQSGEHRVRWSWLGPNSQDTWRNKVERLQTHQLPISKNLQILKGDDSQLCSRHTKMISSETATIQYRAFCVKGYFFQPWQQKALLPDEVSQIQSNNYWLPVKDLKAFIAQSNEHWYPLEKHQWLTATLDSGSQAVDIQQLTEEIQKHSRPRMLANINSPTSNRIMVVSNFWPDVPQ